MRQARQLAVVDRAEVPCDEPTDGPAARSRPAADSAGDDVEVVGDDAPKHLLVYLADRPGAGVRQPQPHRLGGVVRAELGVAPLDGGEHPRPVDSARPAVRADLQELRAVGLRLLPADHVLDLEDVRVANRLDLGLRVVRFARRYSVNLDVGHRVRPPISGDAHLVEQVALELPHPPRRPVGALPLPVRAGEVADQEDDLVRRNLGDG